MQNYAELWETCNSLHNVEVSFKVGDLSRINEKLKGILTTRYSLGITCRSILLSTEKIIPPTEKPSLLSLAKVIQDRTFLLSECFIRTTWETFKTYPELNSLDNITVCGAEFVSLAQLVNFTPNKQTKKIIL